MLSEKPWKIEAVLLLGLALFITMLFGAALASVLKGGGDPGPAGQANFIPFVIGTVSFHGAIIVFVHFFLRYHQVGWAQAFGLNSPRQGFAILLAFVTTIIILPVAWYLKEKLSAVVMTWFQVEPVAQQTVTTLQTTEGVGRQIYFAFMAVALAPTAEELLFRGILYPTMKRVWRPRLAVWVTSILFGAFHINLTSSLAGQIPFIIPLIFLALALTWLYEATDNLLAPILAHSLFNMANFFWLVIERPAA